MKWMNDLKKLMYSNISFEGACDINDIIFEYDKQRAKSQVEIGNAGKQWRYRLNKMCDWRANNVR